MFKHVLVLGLGAAVLSAAALPQQASAQPMRHGFGQMGGGGPEEFRMHGGQGQFGGGHGQFGGGERFHNEFRPFAQQGMARGGAGEFRFQGERGGFGGDRAFRFAGDHRRFGVGGGFRFDHEGHGLRYGDRFRVGGGFDNRRRFERPSFRYGYELGAVRHYPVYRPGFRHGYGLGAVRHYPVYRPGFRYGYGLGFGGSYPVRVGYGFPGADCTTSRSVSLTPAGWHKIVTVRICYVR